MKQIISLFISLWFAVVAFVRVVYCGVSDSFDHSGPVPYLGKVRSVAASCKAWLHSWLSLVQHSPTYV